jgi:hypothetical protein
MRFRVALCALFVAATGDAQDSYTIKLKLDMDVGKSVDYRSSSTGTGSIKFFDLDGKLLLESTRESEETTYRLTVLERDKAGKATRFIRVYDKANELEDGKAKTFSYAGRTLYFEKVGDKFRIGVVGAPPLDAKDIAQLHKKLDKKSDSEPLLRHLSPGKPVKVGDSWSVPVKPVAEAMDDMPADVEKSKITATLVKVYKKGKSQFATFEIKMNMVLAGKIDKDGESMAFDKPGTLTADMMVDAAIDGSTTERKEGGTIAIRGEAMMTTAGNRLRAVFDMKGTGSDEKSAEIDDAKARTVPKVTFAAAPGEWAEFKQKDHAFAARFPGSPDKKAKTDDRGITTTEYSVEIDSRRVYYAVIVSEYPADKFKLDAATVYGNLKKTPGLKESSDIRLAGLAGVEMKQEVKKETTVHVTQRIVIVGQRMYQLMVVAAEGRAADGKQFFESFKLDEMPPVKKKDN